VAALAASGDATPEEFRALKTHTAVCAACQAELAGFEALRGRLQTLRDEGLPDSAYAAVRARVVSQIAGRGRRRWVWAWASLAAAACGVIAAFAVHRAAPVAEMRQSAAPVEIASVQENEPLVPAPQAPRRIGRAVRRIVTREPEAPLVVHMFTSDPNVVMYWVADAKVRSSNKEIVQ